MNEGFVMACTTAIASMMHTLYRSSDPFGLSVQQPYLLLVNLIVLLGTFQYNG